MSHPLDQLLQSMTHSSEDELDDVLKHYGIKGMKWDKKSSTQKEIDKMRKRRNNLVETVKSGNFKGGVKEVEAYHETIRRLNEDIKEKVRLEETLKRGETYRDPRTGTMISDNRYAKKQEKARAAAKKATEKYIEKEEKARAYASYLKGKSYTKSDGYITSGKPGTEERIKNRIKSATQKATRSARKVKYGVTNKGKKVMSLVNGLFGR